MATYQEEVLYNIDEMDKRLESFKNYNQLTWMVFNHDKSHFYNLLETFLNIVNDKYHDCAPAQEVLLNFKENYKVHPVGALFVFHTLICIEPSLIEFYFIPKMGDILVPPTNFIDFYRNVFQDLQKLFFRSPGYYNQYKNLQNFITFTYVYFIEMFGGLDINNS